MAPEPIPSATVVLVRPAQDDLELLLLERRPRRPGPGPGSWVFPGGRVESADRVGREGNTEACARHAAVRETREEAALEIEAASLRPISRWITPELQKHRFDTWFFLSEIGPEQRVRVDGAEIQSHRWLTPRDALAAQSSGEIGLAPPTFVTVSWLADHREIPVALDTLSRGPLLTFRPRICPIPAGACMLYPGDAGYADGDIERSGPRHRLWSRGHGWEYERS